MGTMTIFEGPDHRNLLLEDFSHGLAVQANQHLIVHGKEAMILDPGGHKVYSKVLSATNGEMRGAQLRYLFLSHQDPDIVAATNGWLMTTDADAYCSELWTRFVPHFGLDRYVEDRLKPIPDEGMILELGGADLLIIPAHFLHSCGNHQVYDTVSKLLYTGDLGASLGPTYREVPDFDAHLPSMRGFHERYMASGEAMKLWAEMVRDLDIDVIAPQHGALFRGKDMVARFIDWAASVECGVDRMRKVFRIPTRAA
ncbi:MAG: MBL fold metallo-hydrolase [Sandaracinaceae bacterium]